MNFNSMPLPTPLQKAISKLGFTAPTPIQEKAIPLSWMAKTLFH